jgi:hypothetical protein
MRASLTFVQIWRIESPRGTPSVLHPPRNTTASLSLGVPVAPDGYILASAHGTVGAGRLLALTGPDQKNVLVIKMGESQPENFALLRTEGTAATIEPLPASSVVERPVRLVKRFAASDLVLLKLPYPTPDHVQIFGSAPVPNEPGHFPTNPVHDPVAFLHRHPISQVDITGPSTWFLWLPVKVRQGDSGAPIVNAKGYLLALAVRGYKKEGKDYLLASGIDAASISQAIAADRRRLR